METFKPKNIKNGFAATRLVPFDPNWVLIQLNIQLKMPILPGSCASRAPRNGIGLACCSASDIFAIYAKRATKLLAEIKADIPRGNSTYSMGVLLKMNWVRALTTDLPAWLCFIVAALKTL